MRYFSTFAGIGAFELAFSKLGWPGVGYCEIDPFACAVHDHWWPHMPNFGDISKIDPDDIPDCDLLCGGWPCQDHSIAGKREGLNGSRSSLVAEAIRIVHALRRRGLRWVVLENVPGLFSDDAGRAFAHVVGALVGAEFDVPDGGWQSAGAAVGEYGIAEWRVLDGQHFGPPQRRKRIFIVVDFGDWESREPVLLVPDRLPGNSQTGRAAGADVAGSLAGSAGSDRETVGCINSGGNNGGFRTEPGEYLIASTFGASDGTGGLSGAFAAVENLVCNSINARYGWKQSDRGDGTTPMVAQGLTGNYGNKQDNGIGCMAMIATTLTARHSKGFDSDFTTTVVSENQRGELRESDVVNVNNGGGKPGQGYPAIMQQSTIRKLTPREVSRCFGFPDSHLEDVLWPQKPSKDGRRLVGRKPPSDTVRYRALGNSIVVPVLEWIGRRIESVDKQ